MIFLLKYFPHIFHDELLYSAFSRYCSDIGEGNVKSTLNELFGFGIDNVAVIDFPCHINSFLEQFSGIEFYNAEDIISKFTMLPLFFPFLDSERQKYAVECMKGNNGKGIYMKLGVMASKLPIIKSMKYCPDCVKAEYIKNEYPHWHRSHNLESVKVCHIHHTPLRTHCPVCNEPINPKYKFKLSPLKPLCPYGHDITQPDTQKDDKTDFKHLRYHIAVAETVHYLLNSGIDGVSSKNIYNNYFDNLSYKDLITPNGNIRQTELKKQFLQFYPAEFLVSLGLYFDYNDKYTWFEEIFHKKNCAFHPIKHILLLNFLNDYRNLDSIFSGIQPYKPFGGPPWLCLNPVADHYRKSVITQCNITTCSDTKKPVGTFTCKCGFIYSRRGPDKNESDKLKIGRVKKFGHVWEEALRQNVFEVGGSLRSIARRMGADPATIKKYTQKLLNIPENITAECTINDVSTNSEEKPTIDTVTVSCNMYANTIAGFIYNNAEKPTISDVRNNFKREYAYLYRHDKVLLNSVLSNCKKSTKKFTNQRVDWIERDSALYLEATKIIENILSSEKPLRVTLNRIGRGINSLPLLEQHLDKLPMTKSLISAKVETTEQFQVRRVHKAIESLTASGSEPLEWKIYRKAGLRPNCSPAVKSEIKRLLSVDNKCNFISL